MCLGLQEYLFDIIVNKNEDEADAIYTNVQKSLKYLFQFILSLIYYPSPERNWTGLSTKCPWGDEKKVKQICTKYIFFNLSLICNKNLRSSEELKQLWASLCLAFLNVCVAVMSV